MASPSGFAGNGRKPWGSRASTESPMTAPVSTAHFLHRQPACAGHHPGGSADQEHHRLARHLRHLGHQAVGARHAGVHRAAAQAAGPPAAQPAGKLPDGRRRRHHRHAGGSAAWKPAGPALRRWPRCSSPRAAKLVQEAAHLPLHSVAQLLLTAGQASRPESFEHALQAMALAGALMLSHGCTAMELRMAMLAACCTTWARCTSTRATAKPTPTARWTSRATSSSWCTRTWASC
jgi:hypothetical protein